jgi:hypothetical protein
MDTMDETIQPMPEETEQAPVVDGATKKRWAEFRQRAETCKTYKKKLIRNWSTNIDYRRGKPFASQSDDDQIAVNLDWSLTKTKHAALFSQVPQARLNHQPESVIAPWSAPFERKVNDTIRDAGVESAMEEVLPDCINASGFGAVLASYETLTQDKEVPAIDMSILPPQMAAEALKTGMLFGEPIPMEVVPEVVDKRYTIRRISPSDFLWPVDFTGSDFNNAPWLGHTGRLTWAEAKSRFGLKDEDKPQALSDEQTVEDRLSHDYDREHLADDGKVGFDEIFYHEFQYDTEIKSFSVIRHLVFLHGKSEPVVDEAWKGQQLGPNGKVIGSVLKPLQVLTLTYVTDEDIPPSDSAIGRAQVNEINKGRTQINRQRERSIPVQWFDVNRLDPAIQQALMRGTWQRAIPVQGNGGNVIGSVQQNAMHQENFLFDRIAKADVQEQWTIGSNQMGVGGEVETKGEAGYIQNNFQTKVSMERARVASFFVNIARVVAGYVCLYEDPAMFGEGFNPEISSSLSFSILADSTLLLDSNQRLERLNNFVNHYGKSGWVNLEPVLKEIAQLIGLDPTSVVVPPKPQQPEQPNISLRFTGGEDMMNPLLLAFMIKAGQAPDQPLIEKAKELIQQAVVPAQAPQQGPGGPPMGPGGPVMPGAPPGMPMPLPPPTPVGAANPEMTVMPSIQKRAEEPA